METKGVEFHRRVREGFLVQARAQPSQYLVVDGTREVDAVFAAVLEGVEARFTR